LGDLSLQGTDFIYRVQDKDIRKDMVLQCNFERKNAIKFNACLFEQVAIFFGEDTTIPPPVIIETEKNSDDELISVITEPDKNEISLIERLVKSTFFIEAIERLDSYDAYTGSAVKINSSDLLTACHVVYDYEKKKFIEHIFISNVDHKDDQKRYKAKVIKHDIKKDACVLSSDEISKYPSVPNTKDFDNLKVYEKVYGIGNPNGFTGRTVEGKIISLYSETPGDLKSEGDFPYDPVFLIETNAPVDKGNSGGGIYNAEGNLIGIISACDYVDTTGYPCRLVNPINWSIPASSFKNLTKFDLENDYYVEIQKNEEDNKTWEQKEEERKREEWEKNKKKDSFQDNYWQYDNKTRVTSPLNSGEDILNLKYFWDNEVSNCWGNIILHAKLYNEEQLNYFESMKDGNFSFIIKGADPLNFDSAFIGKVDREYGDVALILIAKHYEKDLFKNKYNSGGKLLIDIINLNNLPKKSFIFPIQNLDLYSNKAYDYCKLNQSPL
jgi:S1-C subfamily serine protease